jgi:hypothetical protein
LQEKHPAAAGVDLANGLFFLPALRQLGVQRRYAKELPDRGQPRIISVDSFGLQLSPSK